MRVIIAAAGTGGHINPGIAIANKIMKEEKDSEIIFIGTNRGLENDLVPRAGYELKTIDAYGLSKKLSIENIKKIYKTYKGIGEARKIVKEFKPDVVIGTGGYICGASILAAKKYKIPTILHESNAFPGKAVKMLSKKVDTVLVGFEEARKSLTKAKNVVVTGTPIKIKKIDFTANEKNKIMRSIGLDSTKPIVLLFGGSQGAKKLNDSMIEIIENRLNNYQIIWAAGPKQYEIIKEELQNKKIDIDRIKGIKILPYIYNMEEIMNVSDLIVARSGAMTVTEISNLGKPAIFIPLPNVSHNHQFYNAKVLQNVGAANIINDNELNGKLLNSNIEQIILDRNILKQMGASALRCAKYDAQNMIYSEIKKIVKGYSS